MDNNIYPIRKTQTPGTLTEALEQSVRFHLSAADIVRDRPETFDVEGWLRAEAKYLANLAEFVGRGES